MPIDYSKTIELLDDQITHILTETGKPPTDDEEPVESSCYYEDLPEDAQIKIDELLDRRLVLMGRHDANRKLV